MITQICKRDYADRARGSSAKSFSKICGIMRITTRRRLTNERGQYTMEHAVLFAAMAIAATLMATYVRQAMRANVKVTELQLNSAMQDNRP